VEELCLMQCCKSSKTTSHPSLDQMQWSKSKATYERQGFVESSLGTTRYMSRRLSTNIHHTTSHDPDRNLEPVDIKDDPCHLVAKVISIVQNSNRYSSGVASRPTLFEFALINRADIRA
jgi:hypothetical protein